MSATLTAPAPAPVPTLDENRFRFTREQYYRMSEIGFFEGRRVERIWGEIVEMSPQGWLHVLSVSKTADELRAAFTGIGWMRTQSPYPTDESDPEPDVSVAPGRREDYTDHPTRSLLTVEVADTTLDRDTTVKAELYATAGVSDYWVIDVENRRLHVFRDPAPLPVGLGATAYRKHDVLGPTDRISPLAAPNASLLVSDLLP